MVICSRNFIAYLVLVVASIVGSFSLLLFGLFLFGGSFTVVELVYSGTGILAWDSLLCFMFFVQHSAMIRKSCRRRLTAIVPHHFQGTLYTFASGVTLLTLVLFWQSSGQTLISLQGTTRWMAHCVFFASLAGMVWGMRALRAFDMFGAQPILANIRDSHLPAMPLAIRGPYRWVRHPLYFFTLVLIWCSPDVTADRLLFDVLFTAWIVLGTLLEERDLAAEFGETYSNYQRKVPMLIPWKLRKPFR